MTKRSLIALTALLGLLISIYLTLYKLGIIGTLQCGAGSCDTVQLSRWGTLLGIPVAAWGVAFYGTVLVLSIASVQDRYADSRPVANAMLALTAWGAVFSVWLTGLEAFVIDAWCRWCVASAILATLLFVLALLDWREIRTTAADDEAPEQNPGG